MQIRKYISNALYIIGQPLLLNIISIPVTAYIIRKLGATGYGQWAVSWSIVAFTAQLSNCGLRSLYIRAIAQETEEMSTQLGKQLGLRIALNLLAAVIAILLALGFGYPHIIVVCVSLSACASLFTTIANTLADTLQGKEYFKTVASVTFVAGLALTALSIWLVARGGGAVGLSLAYISGPFISCSILFFITRKLCKVHILWDWQHNRARLLQARAIAGENILTALQDRVEQILLPKIIGINAFGYFSAGTLFVSRLGYIPDGLTTAAYPGISRAFKENPQQANHETRRLLMLSLIVCIPIAIMTTFLAQPIALVLFPRQPDVCRTIMIITVWSLPLQALIQPIGCALQASGKYAEASRAAMVANIISFVISIVLMLSFGITGACISWIMRKIIMLCCFCPLFLRNLPTVLHTVPFVRLTLCAALMGLILWITQDIHFSALITFVLGSSLALAGYGAALVLFGIVRASDLTRLLFRRT